MENYLALVAIILKAVCGLASLEGHSDAAR